MIKHRKRRLFKNDFLGIKEKMFMRKITNSIKKRNHLVAKQLECLLNMSAYIGIPRTKEETIKLKWIYDKYKSLNSEIESNLNRVFDRICDFEKEN